MSVHEKRQTIALADYDAWLFDLDGVVTRTARVHAAAWKRTFDEYLEARASRTGEPFQPFAIDPEYYRYVDGKPRYEGVDSFLRSRGIVLDYGDPADPPDRETVCGIGNRKNSLFREVLRIEGVEVFPASLQLLKDLRQHGKRLAVVTSSKNCSAVLESAGLNNFFETQIDGNVAARRGLAGKPQPETFVVAARELGAELARTVVFEDAISGVQAGRAGGFGLVVGVARHDEPAVLKENGADIVVRDLAELELT